MDFFPKNTNYPIYHTKEEVLALYSNMTECGSLFPYYDEIITPIMAKEFGLKKCEKKNIWYGEWENHRRFVVKLQMFYSYDLQFGYNYDYIPRRNNQKKFIYHRTEKSVNLDVVDLYCNHISYEGLTQVETFHLNHTYEIPSMGDRNDFYKNYIKNSVLTNLPFIYDFLTLCKSDDDVMRFLDYAIENDFMAYDYWFMWTKAFLHAKYHQMDQALELMQRHYGSYDIPQEVIARLNAVDQMPD